MHGLRARPIPASGTARVAGEVVRLNRPRQGRQKVTRWIKYFAGKAIKQKVGLARESGPGQGDDMEDTGMVCCPYCGQSFELVIDTGVRSQRFVTDCEVCCRPFEVVAECAAGEILSLDVLAG